VLAGDMNMGGLKEPETTLTEHDDANQIKKISSPKKDLLPITQQSLSPRAHLL
jgi:hypothetical protein